MDGRVRGQRAWRRTSPSSRRCSPGCSDDQADAIAAVAAPDRRAPPRATWSSRRAAPPTTPRSTAAYLTEIRLGIPAGLASPSAITVYGARPDLRDALVVGVSPERRLARPERGAPGRPRAGRADPGRHQRARTRRWPSAAELHLDVAAGHERAVAATKTYTAELLALLLLVEGVRAGDGALPAEERAALAQLPELAAADAGRRHRGRARRPVPVRRPAGHHRPRVRVPDRPGGGAEADGDLVPGRRWPSPAPTCCTARWRWPTRTCRCSPSSAPGRAAQSMRDVLARLGERRADLVVVGAGRAEVRLAAARPPAVDERYAAAAGHPAAAAAGAGAGAGPRRGPGRPARPAARSPPRCESPAVSHAGTCVSTLRDLSRSTPPSARPRSSTCTGWPATGS